jgi:hypothetical protein
LVKFVDTRPLADPDAAARKIVELANAVEPYFDNRILIEKINGPFLYGKRQADAVQALKFHGMSLSIWEIGQP